MAKKKKGGKRGVAEGVPLEDYPTHEMTIKDLKKYAVKIGAALKETRTDRSNLEIDRDKMLRNLINVTCRLFMTNRELRRLERELINKQNLCERTVLLKGNELAEIRFKQAPYIYRCKNDTFVSGYEVVKELFKKQDQMFKDWTGLNRDYYKKYLDLEIAFMANKHISLCDKIDKVNYEHIEKLLRKEKSYALRQQKLNSEQYKQQAKILKEIIADKEAIIENVQREHLFQSVDILRSFEEIIKFNFTVINELRDELLDIKNRDLKVTREFKELREKYDLHCSLMKQAQKELVIIRPVVYYLHHTKVAVLTYSKKLQLTEEKTANSQLEADMLEEFIRKDDECTNKLKQIVIKELLSFRQLQVKTHLFMMNLGNKIEEMYADRVRIAKLALYSVEPNLKPYQDIYQRYQCYRRSVVDIVERVLQSHFSNLSSLGFYPEVTPTLPMLKSISPPTQKKKFCSLQTGVPSVFNIHLQKHNPPRMLELVTSLPRVPIRNTTDHVMPFMQVMKATLYVGDVRMSTQ